MRPFFYLGQAGISQKSEKENNITYTPNGRRTQLDSKLHSPSLSLSLSLFLSLPLPFLCPWVHKPLAARFSVWLLHME